MDLPSFFARQLASTAEGFVWAARQVPAERVRQSPPAPDRLGQWSLARHVFHMLNYEREVALPSMRQWLTAQRGEQEGEARSESPLDSRRFEQEDAVWAAEGAGEPLDRLLEDFQAVRDAQIALLPRFRASDWAAVREPIAVWGPVSLWWVVGKTWKHTAQHTDDVMSLVLYWDLVLDRERGTSAPVGE